jgi:hypothetical protein
MRILFKKYLETDDMIAELNFSPGPTALALCGTKRIRMVYNLVCHCRYAIL